MPFKRHIPRERPTVSRKNSHFSPPPAVKTHIGKPFFFRLIEQPTVTYIYNPHYPPAVVKPFGYELHMCTTPSDNSDVNSGRYDMALYLHPGIGGRFRRHASQNPQGFLDFSSLDGELAVRDHYLDLFRPAFPGNAREGGRRRGGVCNMPPSSRQAVVVRKWGDGWVTLH